VVCESKLSKRVEIWGLNGAWKDVDKVHGRLCKKLMALTICATNGFAEMELGRGSKTCNDMGPRVKWIMCLDIEGPVKRSWE
jgi:hypothetical protein